MQGHRASVATDPKSGRTANGRFGPGNPGNPRRNRVKRELRTDGLVNAFTGQGTSRDRRSYTKHRTKPLSDTAALDLARGNWLAKRIVNWLPRECFRKGWTLSIPGKPELVKKVTTAIGGAGGLRLNWNMKRAGAMARAAGGSALFPVLTGALPKLSEPLDLETDGNRILKVEAFHLLEPRELTPLKFYGDIEHPKFRQPELYEVWPLSGGMTMARAVVVHESRLLVFRGERLTEEALPGQRWGWDDNVLTPVHEAIYDYGISWGSAATLLQNFSQRVIKFAQLAEILKEDTGEALIQKRIANMDMVANVLRALPLDKDDELVNVSTSVAGLADLLVELAQVVSAAADMTMTRLFGRAPAGMNATGEYDSDADHERIETEQTDVYTDPVESALRMVMLSQDGPTGGKEPPDWSVAWKPLKQQSAKEVAETRKIDAEADQIRIDSGVISRRDAAKSRYGSDTYGDSITVDWTEWEKQEKVDQERAADIAASLEDRAALGRGAEVDQDGEPIVDLVQREPDPDDDDDDDDLDDDEA